MEQRIRVGVNGFGRIGRYFSRLALMNPQIDLVAVNDLAPIETLVHLLKYDSIHGRMHDELKINDNQLIFNQTQKIEFLQYKNPEEIPWGALGVDIVIESTGLFLTSEKAGVHLKSGAKRVILSAPSVGDDIFNVVIGVNDHLITDDHKIISNASCTTNSAAPLVAVLKEFCDIEEAYITTIHSYTSDQRLHDSPHKDLRRARAAAQSIVPTSTGAAKAITRIFPELEGKMGGCGMRVPVPDGSLTDLTVIVKENPPTVEQINTAFKNAAESNLKGIVRYTEDPIVSVDILGDSNSCIFDSELTSVIGNMIKVVGWYDNEAGFSNRLIDLVIKLG
ncbi:MAG: glyceraldehyde-3-phosphate dehydrogenase, type [Fluviicola sp.]|jgi:glyceraldehyde 3-phosphate dehydrogenase|uniref:type I glyceraldehyde-3-phosphate dehydrogenase n=1 Tax=Fluviicola sp. TaxID=1917219 RepID=UPI002609CC29|nr:type I glyceraldehyde-3-phosphate dehydrogenase [Fluviicola sp.]MDF3026477.1 glyceraldehyde-3-phosphate dehydrogenase, type [Fluviicola sp.]